MLTEGRSIMTVTPDLMTFSDVLHKLRGGMGRNRLYEHLAHVPEFEGRPTYSRWGNRYVFTTENYQTLKASLSCPSSSSKGKNQRTGMSVVPSRARSYGRALELLSRKRPKSTVPSGKANSGRKASMAQSR